MSRVNGEILFYLHLPLSPLLLIKKKNKETNHMEKKEIVREKDGGRERIKGEKESMNI